MTRSDTPSVYEALVEDGNALESRIIKLNGKIASIKWKHNPDRKSLCWSLGKRTKSQL